MSLEKLSAALNAVDWNKNVTNVLADTVSATTIAERNLRIAVWARQFEIADKGNPALCFVREMQIAGQHVAALIALALYKPAASSMRAMFETALYYSYFRTHPSELATLVRDVGFYVEKRTLLEYHKIHTPRFPELQHKLGLVSRLDHWYSQVSAVIHGQIPGAWVEHKTVAEIAPIKKLRMLSWPPLLRARTSCTVCFYAPRADCCGICFRRPRKKNCCEDYPET